MHPAQWNPVLASAYQVGMPLACCQYIPGGFQPLDGEVADGCRACDHTTDPASLLATPVLRPVFELPPMVPDLLPGFRDDPRVESRAAAETFVRDLLPPGAASAALLAEGVARLQRELWQRALLHAPPRFFDALGARPSRFPASCRVAMAFEHPDVRSALHATVVEFNAALALPSSSPQPSPLDEYLHHHTWSGLAQVFRFMGQPTVMAAVDPTDLAERVVGRWTTIVQDTLIPDLLAHHPDAIIPFCRVHSVASKPLLAVIHRVAFAKDSAARDERFRAAAAAHPQ